MCIGDNETDNTVGGHFCACVTQLIRNLKFYTESYILFNQSVIVSTVVKWFMD
jgi:hypothetical protein